MGTMAATLAHELNQPPTSISNYAAGCLRLLETGSPDAGDLKEPLGRIRESSERAGEIIRRLRDMTTKRDGRQEVFSLAGLVTETFRLVASACDGVKLSADLQGAGLVKGDRIQIQQVIMNLLRNACEALGKTENGRVIAAGSVDADHVISSIEDSGPGVSQEAERHLFEWTDSAKPAGMGIGLAVSRTIIEGHGGHIWLKESSMGGACFCFSLPLAGKKTAGGQLGDRHP